MDLKKSLRLALAHEGIKKSQLAERLDTSSQQVSNWLRTGKMKQSSIEDVSAAFNMSVSQFIALGENS